MKSVRKEFARELEFMKSIRHPNIVMFFGAGRSTQSGTPFLVIEYAGRGSLTAVLKDTSQQLTWSLQLKMALDAAKGMWSSDTVLIPQGYTAI